MRIRVLGSAAGGGFPQWNCGCSNCAGLRGSAIRARARTQECVAVSADGERWVLLNASPEIRAQIESFAPLHPHAPRHSPIAAIVLTNGDLDHCLGLLSLRESHPLVICATDAVRRGFTERNVLYRTLERFEGQVIWKRLHPGSESLSVDGLSIAAVAAPGKPPVHLEGIASGDAEENIGLSLRDAGNGRVLGYFPSAGGITEDMRRAMENADVVFFDGTFWSASELVDLGLGKKLAEDMAHLPIAGAEGSLAALAGLRAGRRIFIHINNTNPMLREDSDEARAVAAAGWEIAYDGMEIEL